MFCALVIFFDCSTMTRYVGGYRQCVSVSCMHCVAHLGIGAVLASLLPPHRPSTAVYALLWSVMRVL